jgi:hypothetical protein
MGAEDIDGSTEIRDDIKRRRKVGMEKTLRGREKRAFGQQPFMQNLGAVSPRHLGLYLR